MVDFTTGEYHQMYSEFFPMQTRTGKRGTKAAVAKMLTAVTAAAAAAIVALTMYIDCFATSITPDSADRKSVV